MSLCHDPYNKQCASSTLRGQVGRPCVRDLAHCSMTNKQLIDNNIRAPFSVSQSGSLSEQVRQPINQLTQYFDSYHLKKVLTSIDKNSASDSVIAFASHIGEPDDINVVFKAHIVAHGNSETNPLAFENEMYSQLLKLTDSLPNLIRFGGSIVLNTSMDELYAMAKTKSVTHSKFYYSLINLATETGVPYGDVDVRITVTEDVGPNVYSLANLFDSNKLTESTLRTIMFQIVYTLASLQLNGFQHNDLHPGNILINMTPNPLINNEPTRKYRWVDPDTGRNTYFEIPSHHPQAMLFDWDFGVCTTCYQSNDNLEYFCDKKGICNQLNSRFDIYTLLSSLAARELDSFIEFNKFVDNIIGDSKVHHCTKSSCTKNTPKSYDFVERFNFRMCDLKNGICVPFKEGYPTSITSVFDALYDPYFELFISRRF